MTLLNEVVLVNTRAKLARMEARYEQRRNETGGDEELRAVTMRSLKKYINQFKEEIARYATGASAGQRTGLRSERELTNTRAKLEQLEALYEAHQNRPVGEQWVRGAERTSLKRLINQLKEEIVLYEIHQPARG